MDDDSGDAGEEFSVFIIFNGWICLHDVLDQAGSRSVFERT